MAVSFIKNWVSYKPLILYNITLTRGLEHLSCEDWESWGCSAWRTDSFLFWAFLKGPETQHSINLLLATLLYRITWFYLQHIRCSTPPVLFTNTCICCNSCSPPSFYQTQRQEQELLSSLHEDISLPCTNHSLRSQLQSSQTICSHSCISPLLHSPLDSLGRDNSPWGTTHNHLSLQHESNLSKPFLLTVACDSPSGGELNGVYYAVFYSSITL